MSHNLKQRLISGIFMLAIAIATLWLAGGFPFRIFYLLASAMALIELFTNLRAYSESNLHGLLPHDYQAVAAHVFIQAVIISVGAFAVAVLLPRRFIILTIVIAYANDIGAYTFGKLTHGLLFTSKPFPETSPNKSWEGFIGGALTAAAVCAMVDKFHWLGVLNDGVFISTMLIGWFVAVFGDWFESRTKRLLGIKDAGDILQDTPFFRHVECITAGHGGFLDRLDSLSAVAIFVALTIAIF